jgi:hypothetical protein
MKVKINTKKIMAFEKQFLREVFGLANGGQDVFKNKLSLTFFLYFILSYHKSF